VDELHQHPDRRRIDLDLRAELRDDCDLRVDLRLSLAYGEIAPDAGMGLCGMPVELREDCDARLRR
jgi:hypothetical protein